MDQVPTQSESPEPEAIIQDNQARGGGENRLKKIITPKYLPIFFLVAVSLFVGIVYFINKQSIGKKLPTTLTPTRAPHQVFPTTLTPTPAFNFDLKNVQRISVSGTVKEVGDLGLVKKDDSDNNQSIGDKYFEAGTITSGPYKGYKRIVVYVLSQGANWSWPMYILVTKDNKSYVLDWTSHAQLFRKYRGMVSTFGQEFDRSKVTKIDAVGLTVPLTINAGGQFVMSLDIVSPRITKNINAHWVRDDLSDKDTSLHPLTTVEGMQAYEQLTQPVSDENLKSYPADQRVKIRELENYLYSTTQVFVEDEAGLLYNYNLSTKDNIATYFSQVEANRKAQELRDANPSSPEPPRVDFEDNLGFKATNATFNLLHYDTYSTALPHACGGDVNTPVLKNITDTDLEKIGSIYGGDMYRLKNLSHPLYKSQEDTKDFWNYDLNKSVAPPLSEYVSKNPLIIIKDPWNRYVLLGEWNYHTPGGCGKPVVYLYPQKPTQVKVRLLAPMNFTKDIPHYVDGWDVLAEPDGRITDLQPQYTDCSKLPTELGSEYAKQACQTKVYPYLYWSGSVQSHGYTVPKKGWIVPRSELKEFLTGKLEEMGMNTTEQNDMLAYWIPEMLTKQGKFYRVAFLQTTELNEMIPMEILPKPDHIFRLFLDWSSYETIPGLELAPQKLGKINRSGFSVVEWGGLKN